MEFRALLVFVGVVVVQCQGQSIQGYVYPLNCAAPNTTTVDPSLPPGTKAPPLPFVPTTFQTRVEANIIDKSYSIVAEEYYDFTNNRAALRIVQNNSMDYMVFDYKNNQILNVVNGACYATDLQFDDNNQLFGIKSGLSGIPHIYSTASALHFAQTNGVKYMGRSTTRGIPTDHWQSCMTWPLLLSNFTLDYFFTAWNKSGNMWLEPDMSQVVPIRAEVTGMQLTTSLKNFHHIYEYFDFRNHIWGDDTVFETPQGMKCSGRKQTRTVPTLGHRYSYREEIIRNNGVSQVDVWYDFDNKLMRYDYRPPYTSYPFNTKNPVTEIHDYNTGIAYAIDRANGNCTTLPIQNSTFDASINVTSSQGAAQFYIQMKSPSQLFYLDNTSYTYEGVRTVRGMLCDVFISTRTDFALPMYGQFNSTFEFYFLNSDWHEANDAGKKDQTDTAVPVQLRITTPDTVGYTATYNIYNFDKDTPTANVFDVRTCYSDNNKQNFIIEFDGQNDPAALGQYENDFRDAVIKKMQQQGHFSPIRVQNVQVHILPTQVYMLGTLLDLPPVISYYRQIPGMYMLHNNDKTLTGVSASDCANDCNDPTILSPCNSFDFCAATSTCSLSRTTTDTGNLASSPSKCNHYSRTLKSLPTDMALTTGWNFIKDNVYQKNFMIKVGGVTYTASSIDKNVKLDANRQLSSQTLLNQFNAQLNKNIPGHDDLILTGTAVDDCATACVNRQDWICNSFTFCFDSGYCTLSKLHPDTQPSIVKNAPLCDLYSRKYTSGYQMIPGTTALSSSDTIYQNIYSGDQCAQLCSNYNGFNCKSFDYCPGISTCYLGRTHYYDVPKADRQDSTMCNHYSRKYIADFQKTTKKKLTNVADRIISNIPVDQCAKLCVEQESFNCASFGYCGNTTECRLSTASMSNVGQLTSEPSLWCDIYNRKYYPDGTAYTAASTAPAPDTSSKYTGGSMAGIGLGMLIIGLLIGFVAFFAINKFRGGGGGGDGMGVRFVNQESES